MSKNATLNSDVRIEHDLIGERAVPAEAYYGVQTARAIDNFHISGVPLNHYPELIKANAMVKLAAARANRDCGLLTDDILKGITGACEELIAGKLHEQFPLDVFQGGAGTSTNMNANEVIANRALELLGHQKGEYAFCDPHNHVNCSQSTNDAYPSALKLAMALANRDLVIEIAGLVADLRAKAAEFRHIIKMGRTQLQDAVPMTMGQEFGAWAASLENETEALKQMSTLLLTVNMGGTAIGTGLNAPEDYPQRCVVHLVQITGMPIRLATNLIEATQDTQPFVIYSAGMKSLAIKLSKICNDLRLLSSGPRCGLHEINLPPMQPGSSIMPGKVNPVIPEVVNQVCFRVIGNDLTVTMAAEAGQLQLNVMEPVIGLAILESIKLFKNATATLRHNCIRGITANEARCRQDVEQSIGVVTALVPYLGYDTCTDLAAEAQRANRGIVELVRERNLLTEDQIREMLDPEKMIGPMRRV